MILSDEVVVEALDAALAAHDVIDVRLFGRSMIPTIWPGSRVRIQACDPASIRAGDVLLARRGDTTCAHRVVRRRGDQWICRGDFHDGEDSALRDEEILGRLISIHVGPLRMVPPDPVRRAWDRAAWLTMPLLRALRGPVIGSFRRADRALRSAPVISQIRRHVRRFDVARAEPTHWSAIRAALLRRGLRPTRAHARSWERRLAGSAGIGALLGLTPSGRVVGWLCFAATDQGVHLLDLYVARDHRGLGMASALVAAAIPDASVAAHASGTAELYAHVRPDGPAARAFTRHGFVPAPDRPSVTPHHVRVVRRATAATG